MVVGVIVIVISIAVLAINPDQRLGQARNDQRRSDLSAILNAFYQYSLHHNGTFPVALTSKDQEICKSKSDWSYGIPYDCKGLLSLESLTGSYLVKVPMDPLLSDSSHRKYRGTWYRIRKGATDNRITVTSSGSLLESVSSGKPQEISVSH